MEFFLQKHTNILIFQVIRVQWNLYSQYFALMHIFQRDLERICKDVYATRYDHRLIIVDQSYDLKLRIVFLVLAPLFIALFALYTNAPQPFLICTSIISLVLFLFKVNTKTVVQFNLEKGNVTSNSIFTPSMEGAQPLFGREHCALWRES